MKKIFLFTAVILSAFLISCDSKNALNFNDKLVDIQKDLLKLIDDSKLTDTANLASKLQKITNYTKDKIAEISNLKTPSGAENFKKAMIEYLESIHTYYDFSGKLIDPNLSDIEYTKLEAQLTQYENKSVMLENKVIQEQRNFARAKNFDLKN